MENEIERIILEIDDWSTPDKQKLVEAIEDRIVEEELDALR